MRDIILREFLESMEGVPFRYGENDCGLFVAEFLKRLHGVDYAEDYRGQYTSQEEALELLDIEEELSKILDGPHPVSHARTGDVAVRQQNVEEQIKTMRLLATRAEQRGDHESAEYYRIYEVESGLCLGVVQGRWVYTPHDHGPTRTPLSEWERCYRA